MEHILNEVIQRIDMMYCKCISCCKYLNVLPFPYLIGIRNDAVGHFKEITRIHILEFIGDLVRFSHIPMKPTLIQ